MNRGARFLLLLLLLVLVSPLLYGCGDVCARLPSLTENRCGVEVQAADNSGETTVCDGEAEVAARCAADNKAAYCEWLEAFAAGDVEYENEYTACVESGD